MTLSTLSTDEDLVAGARAGEGRAFEELYARYGQRIRAYVMRLTSDHDRADDITQEVFISALRRLRETDAPIVFRPWVYEIARNACIDEYRRRRRVQEVPIERDEEATWNGGPILASVPSPEVAVESKQQLDDLCGAFRGLSERHHKIIVLREFEGLSYSQIGDRLGMSRMVVESTLFRARRRLSEEFQDLTSGRRCSHVLQMLADDDQRPVRRLGLRDRRALSQHLEHCPGCRRQARAAGIEDKTKMSLPSKAAAFLPLPIFGWLGRAAQRIAGGARGFHHALLPPASSVGAYAAPIGLLGSSGRGAATAVTLIAAAVGGGIATDVGGSFAGTSSGHAAMVSRGVDGPNPSVSAAFVAGAPVRAENLLGAGGHRAEAKLPARGAGQTRGAFAPGAVSNATLAPDGSSGVAGSPSGAASAGASAGRDPQIPVNAGTGAPDGSAGPSSSADASGAGGSSGASPLSSLPKITASGGSGGSGVPGAGAGTGSGGPSGTPVVPGLSSGSSSSSVASVVGQASTGVGAAGSSLPSGG
jgi:RNA polymerase sigma factor (sigma-70 family)